jgi:WD40 repeat protein
MRLALLSMAALAAAPACGQTAVQAPACEDDCHHVGYDPLAETLTMAGVPHTATIDSVALSPNGRAALTRDRRGGVRLWTALDGSAEPIPLPLGPIAAMSVDASGDIIAIAAIDTSGAAQLLTYDGDDFEHHMSLPPHAGIRSIVVTAHGRRALALGTDDSVRLYTLTGDELDRWQPRDISLSDLLVSSTTSRAIAVSRDGSSATRVEISKNLARLHVRDEATLLELPIERRARDAVRFAASPDGRLLAYMAGGGDEAYTMWLHDLDADTALDTFVPISTSAVPTLGFTEDRQIVAGDRTSRSLWQFDVSSTDIDAVEIEVHAHEAVIPAYGAGLRIGARSTWLMVHSVSDASTQYLGYDAFAPRRAALAPDNGHVAWAAERSVFIEAIAGDDDRVHLDQASALNGTISGLFFFDEDHLIEVDTAGQLLFVKWRTGEVVDAVSTRKMHTAAHYDHAAQVVRIHTPDGPVSFGVDSNLGFVRPVTEPRAAPTPRPIAVEPHVPVVRRSTSPSGNAIALIRADGFVDIYDSVARARAWSYSSGDAEAWTVEWAPDGSTIAIAGTAGAAVLDARTGSIVHKRCATHFQVRSIVMGGDAHDGPASICE